MFGSGYFQSRPFRNTYFQSLYQEPNTSPYFIANYFKSGLFENQYFGLVEGLATLDMFLSTTNTRVGNPITIRVVVRDENGNPVPGVAVTFTTDTNNIIKLPPLAYTDTAGQAVVVAMAIRAGSTYVLAQYNGQSAGSNLNVTRGPGGVTAGSSGGGSPGPINTKLTKVAKRWPTR